MLYSSQPLDICALPLATHFIDAGPVLIITQSDMKVPAKPTRTLNSIHNRAAAPLGNIVQSS